MASISLEQPPSDTPDNLKEYLTRMLVNINIATQNNAWIIPQTRKPDRPQVGRLYYFKEIIPGDPDITEVGLYVYTAEGWLSIATYIPA